MQPCMHMHSYTVSGANLIDGTWTIACDEGRRAGVSRYTHVTSLCMPGVQKGFYFLVLIHFTL